MAKIGFPLRLHMRRMVESRSEPQVDASDHQSWESLVRQLETLTGSSEESEDSAEDKAGRLLRGETVQITHGQLTVEPLGGE